MKSDEKGNDKEHDNASNVDTDPSSAMTTIKDNKKVVWSPENELIMVEWCDVAQCYKWLNSRSHAKYSYMHAWYTIPAIILSTISGTASFAQQSLPANYQTFSPLIIGSINIFIGILTTIQQYLKISELNEAHRVSAIAWDKFARNIRIELSKHPDERTDAKTFLKVCRQEFDRLMETSPDIKEKVIHEFNSKFTGKEGSKKRRQFEQLRKPDICDTIISANETRHKWYKELEDSSDSVDEDERKRIIQQQKEQIEQREKELKAFSEMEDKKMDKQLDALKRSRKIQEDNDKLYNEQCSLINKYIQGFYELYERKPLRDEIITNIGDTIDESSLYKFLDTYSSDGGINMV